MAGAWPTEVELTLSGLVMGVPDVSGVFSVTVRVTSGTQTADRVFSLTIDGSGLTTWEWTEVPTPFGFASTHGCESILRTTIPGMPAAMVVSTSPTMPGRPGPRGLLHSPPTR